MTPRERVLEAIAHKETDFVPYVIVVEPEADAEFVKYYGGPQYRARIIDHLALVAPRFFHGIAPYPHPDGTSKDIFGGVWQQGNIPHQLEYPLKEASLEGLVWPDVTRDEDYEPVYEVTRANPDTFTITGILMTLFERAWALRGMENILMDMACEPAFCEELFEKIADWDMAILQKLCDAPVDGVGFTDDYGTQRGLIMGPDYWRKYIKPHMARLFAYVKSRGKYTCLHSCGDNSEIMGELIDIGLDLFDPLQPEAMDIFDIKRTYGASITFHGGISSQRTLPFGTPEEVRQEVEKCLRYLGEGGGYIAAPNKGIMNGTPVANAVAVIEALVNQ